LATKISPPKLRRKGKNKDKVQKPDFRKQNKEYPGLLDTMREELQCHELHSSFDYLSFYRRAYDLVLWIREEVLFSDAVQLYRGEDMAEDQTPSNHRLLADLFRALQIQPKTRKKKEAEVEGPGQELSTKVVPLRQLKQVTDLMAELIYKKGSIELERAKLRRACKWDDLKASYAAEEVEKNGPAPTPTSVSTPTPAPENAIILLNGAPVLEKADEEDRGERLLLIGSHDTKATSSDQADEAFSPCLAGPEHSVQPDSPAQPTTPLNHHKQTAGLKPDEVKSTLNGNSTQESPVAEPQASSGEDRKGKELISTPKMCKRKRDGNNPESAWCVSKKRRGWVDASGDLKFPPPQVPTYKRFVVWNFSTETEFILYQREPFPLEKVHGIRPSKQYKTTQAEARATTDLLPLTLAKLDRIDKDATVDSHLGPPELNKPEETLTREPSTVRCLMQDTIGEAFKLVSDNVSHNPLRKSKAREPGLCWNCGEEGHFAWHCTATDVKPSGEEKVLDEVRPLSLIVKLRVSPARLRDLFLELQNNTLAEAFESVRSSSLQPSVQFSVISWTMRPISLSSSTSTMFSAASFIRSLP
jgi:hypothetical protein